MLIIHRCPTCKSPDYWAWHGGKKTAGDKVDGAVVPIGERRHCCRSTRWSKPETAPRWTSPDHVPITEVLQPGEPAPGGTATCNCDECWALWLQLTGAKKKPRRLQAVT